MQVTLVMKSKNLHKNSVSLCMFVHAEKKKNFSRKKFVSKLDDG